MAAKLKSILRQIHWSSLLKGAVFGAAWFFLPFWAFLLIALYLYFIPRAQWELVVIPFLSLILLATLESPGILPAFIFGLIFFYILLIKDLLLIDRKSAYEMLVLGLFFMLARRFYLSVGGNFSGASLLYSFLVAALFAALAAGYVACFDGSSKSIRRMANWLMFLLMWQFLIVGLVLPLDFIYQTVIIFLIAMLLLDLIPPYLFGELSRVKILATSSVAFVLVVLILGSARWGL